jgi:hypothetical protein
MQLRPLFPRAPKFSLNTTRSNSTRRRTEVQRSAFAAAALGVLGAIIGELLRKWAELSREDLLYTLTLLLIGLIAWLLTAKLYERSRLHM